MKDLLAPAAEYQCAGKHPFDSRALANEVASRSSRRRDATLQTYRCPCCMKWHIGNTNPVARRAAVSRKQRRKGQP